MSTQTIDTDLNSAPTRRPGESPRQQSVCIEIPVTVHGSRSASGNLNNSQAAKPFLEETRTMIVFPSGAVLRLTEAVSEGQILILKNARVKQEVACRVVSSKTNASAKGYVEVEFFQAAPGFWGITFPSASSSPATELAPAAPEPKQPRVEPAAAKPAFFQPPAAAPKPVAPVAPVVSRIEPKPVPSAPVELAPVISAPSVAASIIAERSVPEPFVLERTVPERAVPERAVQERIVAEPVKPAPVFVAPVPPVLTPDSTQELNAAIAAAYASQVEPIKPIKKYEPVRESKPAKEPAPFSAAPSASIVDTLPPPPNKQLNPTKPKFTAPAAKPSRETVSASELLPMAESIGYQSSEFSGYGKSESPVKSVRNSASAASSSIENRKLDLSSSQIASEAVLGKPMFGSSVEDSSEEKSGSSNKWIIPVAASVILALGAGGFWWFSAHKAGAAKPATVSASAPAASPSVLPPIVGPALPAAAGANSQPSVNPNAQQNSANQKSGTVPAGAAGNSLVANSNKTSEPVNSHRPTVLPAEKIAAPVSHANSSSVAAPDVVSNSSSAPGGSLSSILPGMSQPSSAPAPPPSRPAGPPPVASVLQQPKLIKSDSPVYPRIAATRGDWGDVVIDATVGESGQVTDAKVISGPETLRQPALQVVRTQTYQPAKLNGKSVSMHVMVKVPFPKPR